MTRKSALASGIILSLVVVSVVFAEDAVVSQAVTSPETQGIAAPVEAPVIQAPAVQAEPEMQWLWGEAVSVDIQKNEVVVRYQDYDTEQEKEMTVSADTKTTFENVRSLAEVQPKDTLSIDYKVLPDGKNIARNISVEKAESMDAVSSAAVAAEAAPAATQGPATTPAQ
jgi:hypothetical protein